MQRRVEVVDDLLREARAVPPVRPPAPPDGARHLADAVRFALGHPAAMRRLHLATDVTDLAPALEDALPVLLDRGLWLLRADLGLVHVLDSASGALRLVAHSGFDADVVEHHDVVDDALAAFAGVTEDGQALIRDVDADPGCTPWRSAATRYGIRAVQSTLLLDYAGRTVGAFSTFWRRPGGPPLTDLRAFALYATYAGEQVATRLARDVRTAPDDAPPGPVARGMIEALLMPARGSGRDGAREGAERQDRTGPFTQALRVDDGVAALADLVVTSVFTAELELDAARSLTDEEPVGKRIEAATSTLEQLVVRLRAAMLARGASEEDEGPGTR